MAKHHPVILLSYSWCVVMMVVTMPRWVWGFTPNLPPPHVEYHGTATSSIFILMRGRGGSYRSTGSGAISYPTTLSSRGANRSHWVALHAKQQRRRRRRQDFPDNDNDASASTNTNGDDLPDFDLIEDVSDATQSSSSLSRNADTNNPSGSQPTSEMNYVTSNMMKRNTNTSTRSVSDLLKDRSLESKFVFEGESTVDLPDLSKRTAPTATTVTNPDNINKLPKRERDEARRQAARARDEAKANSAEIRTIPFLTDETGKITGFKVLETGTWLGIFLLVAWEIYLNSPFFDRAAPMAPIVY